MSTGEESYASRDDGTSRPSFELALRGYDKRQVDRYVEQMDGALSTLTADRAQAAGQIQGADHAHPAVAGGADRTAPTPGAGGPGVLP